MKGVCFRIHSVKISTKFPDLKKLPLWETDFQHSWLGHKTLIYLLNQLNLLNQLIHTRHREDADTGRGSRRGSLRTRNWPRRNKTWWLCWTPTLPNTEGNTDMNSFPVPEQQQNTITITIFHSLIGLFWGRTCWSQRQRAETMATKDHRSQSLNGEGDIWVNCSLIFIFRLFRRKMSWMTSL